MPRELIHKRPVSQQQLPLDGVSGDNRSEHTLCGYVYMYVYGKRREFQNEVMR